MADDELVNPRARGQGRGAELEEGVPGHVTRAGPAGLAFHCPICDQVTLYGWGEIEKELRGPRDPIAVDTVRLPACACGAQSWLSIDDHEDWDPDGDDAYTRRAVHEHVMPRLGWIGLRVQSLERELAPARARANPHARPPFEGGSSIESQVGRLPGPDGVVPPEPDQGWDVWDEERRAAGPAGAPDLPG